MDMHLNNLLLNLEWRFKKILLNVYNQEWKISIKLKILFTNEFIGEAQQVRRK